MQNYQQQPFNPNIVPLEIKKWNWGSFMFNIWWGIGHKVYLPLLCLIPIFNIVWIFICGAKGNEWAWKTGVYSTPEDLIKSQVSWNRAGFVYFIISIVLIVLYVLFFASMFVALIGDYGQELLNDDGGYNYDSYDYDSYDL